MQVEGAFGICQKFIHTTKQRRRSVLLSVKASKFKTKTLASFKKNLANILGNKLGPMKPTIVADEMFPEGAGPFMDLEEVSKSGKPAQFMSNLCFSCTFPFLPGSPGALLAC